MITRLLRILFSLAAIIALASCTSEPPRRPMPSRDRLIDYNRQLVSRDSAFIVHYCASQQLDSVPTREGLWITETKVGEGSAILQGSVVTLAYRISDITGKLYYSSDNDGVKRFSVGAGNDIMALDLALPMFHKGSVATLIVMPDLAYGLHGDDDRIGMRRILRYDIEVLDVQ